VTGRILRIELRRSNARWLALLLLLVPLATFGEAGRGLTVLALDQRQLLLGTFPLVMGVAAWQARRDRRSRVDELLATTARPRWQRVLPAAAALAIAAVAAYVAAVAANVGLVIAADGYLSVVTAPIIAVGVLFIVVPVAFGLALGRWLPFILIPPLLVVYLLVSLIFADTEAYPGEPGPPGRLLLWGDLQVIGISFDVAAITARTHLGQGLWAVALTAAALIVFATARLRTRAAAAVVAVALGAAVAVALLPDRYADAYYLDPRATTPVCTPDTPRVCVTRAHQAALADLRGPARQALAIMAAKLPDAPTSVIEIPDTPGGDPSRPRADTAYIVLSLSGAGRDTRPASDTMWVLLAGAGTPGCANAPAFGTAEGRRYEIARIVAAAWLFDREPPAAVPLRPSTQEVGSPDPSDPALLRPNVTRPAYQALRELPPAEQRTRVAALRAAELACDGRDRLEILTGSGGS
jgi:hypothetical protein